MKWPNVPDCVNEIKDNLFRRITWFGEVQKENIRIQKLDIFAWVTSGNKKASSISLLLSPFEFKVV